MKLNITAVNLCHRFRVETRDVATTVRPALSGEVGARGRADDVEGLRHVVDQFAQRR